MRCLLLVMIFVSCTYYENAPEEINPESESLLKFSESIIDTVESINRRIEILRSQIEQIESKLNDTQLWESGTLEDTLFLQAYDKYGHPAIIKSAK